MGPSPVRSHHAREAIAEVAADGQVAEKDAGGQQPDGHSGSGDQPGAGPELPHQDAGADGAEHQGHLADRCGGGGGQ